MVLGFFFALCDQESEESRLPSVRQHNFSFYCWNLPHTIYVFHINVCNRSQPKCIRQYTRKKHFGIISVLNLSLFLCYLSINDQAPFINILLSTFWMGISAMLLDDIQAISEPYCSILCSYNFLGFCSTFFSGLPIFEVPMECVQVSVLILLLFIVLSCPYSEHQSTTSSTTSSLCISVCNSAHSSEILYLSRFFPD